MDDDDVPDDPDAPELKLVLMALKLIFREDIAEKITEILEKLKTDDPELHDVVRMVWYYFTASGKYADRDYGVLYETIKKIVEVESMPTLLEKWTADAVAKKEAEMGRNMVLVALRTRFNKIPKEVEDAVRTMSDSIALESLHVEAIQCDTLDEFIEGLR